MLWLLAERPGQHPERQHPTTPSLSNLSNRRNLMNVTLRAGLCGVQSATEIASLLTATAASSIFSAAPSGLKPEESDVVTTIEERVSP
mgnify:CR=1 FL=1